MKAYHTIMARHRKWMFFLLAFFVLGAGFSPYPTVFIGLTLGGTVSLYNLWLLQKKVNDFGDAVIRGERPRGLGLTSRFAAAILAVLIAIRFQEHIHMVGVLVGLLTSYIVMYADLVINQMLKTDEEGEKNGS